MIKVRLVKKIEGVEVQNGDTITLGVKVGMVGASAYQSYLKTTTDNPPLSEAEWSAPFELTKQAVDDVIGVSEDGNQNKFYNELGNFVIVEGGAGEVTPESVDEALSQYEETSMIDESDYLPLIGQLRIHIGNFISNIEPLLQPLFAEKTHQHEFGDIPGLEDALSGKVDANEEITAETKTKITYDNKGLVTGGDVLSPSDIPTLAQSKITNLTNDLASKVRHRLFSGFADEDNPSSYEGFELGSSLACKIGIFTVVSDDNGYNVLQQIEGYSTTTIYVLTDFYNTEESEHYMISWIPEDALDVRPYFFKLKQEAGSGEPNVIESLEIGGQLVPITAKKLTVVLDESLTYSLDGETLNLRVSDALKAQINRTEKLAKAGL